MPHSIIAAGAPYRMRVVAHAATLLISLPVACSTANEPGGAMAGMGGAAGTNATGGTSGGGGAGETGMGGSGGQGVGGMAGTGGTTGMRDGGTGGSGGTAGTGGTTGAGGNPGMTGTGGSIDGGGRADGSGSSPVVPSAGCAKMTGRPAGGVVTVANDHIYNFPASYDGRTPMPLVIALHAAGNPNTQLQGLTNGTRLDTNFVRAFPKSAGSAWVIGTDAARITSVYNDLIATYCIDTSRVFATGHSSGAQMVVQMLCATGGEKRFKAVAPVAASKYCATVSPIAAMYIQGMMDAMRSNSNGIDVVNFFSSSNMCGSATVPDTAVPTCTSTFDRMLVTPGCVTYQDCTAPTIWCSHNDNGYNATDGKQHGWPCFASNAIADFFLGMP